MAGDPRSKSEGIVLLLSPNDAFFHQYSEIGFTRNVRDYNLFFLKHEDALLGRFIFHKIIDTSGETVEWLTNDDLARALGAGHFDYSLGGRLYSSAMDFKGHLIPALIGLKSGEGYWNDNLNRNYFGAHLLYFIRVHRAYMLMGDIPDKSSLSLIIASELSGNDSLRT